jgi:hypothetical protein
LVEVVDEVEKTIAQLEGLVDDFDEDDCEQQVDLKEEISIEKQRLREVLDDKSRLLADQVDAAKKYHDKRNALRDGAECKEFVSRIAELRETEKNAVHKCHSASQAFLSTYSTILYPKFSVDERMVSKGGSGGLAKNWKGPGARQAHGAHRSRVVRKLGLLGKVAVNVSEACSTMMCPFCRTLSSPGKSCIFN